MFLLLCVSENIHFLFVISSTNKNFSKSFLLHKTSSFYIIENEIINKAYERK